MHINVELFKWGMNSKQFYSEVQSGTSESYNMLEISVLVTSNLTFSYLRVKLINAGSIKIDFFKQEIFEYI